MRVISSKPDTLAPVSEATRAVARPVRDSLITALEAQERDRDRVNVFVDGKFAVGVFADVAVSLGLRVGQQITPERLAQIAQAETVRRAKEDAARLLGFRARSEKETETRLKQKGYEDDVIAQVVQSLRDLGYLDDDAFASSWVASRGKTRGRRALSHELRQKGIVGDKAQEVLTQTRDDETEQEAAYHAAVKRVGTRPADSSREARARLAAFLQRRGFDWDTVKPVLARVYAGVSDEERDAED